MTNRKSHGSRKKTRQKFKRPSKRLTSRAILREFEAGTRVHVRADSSVHSGFPHKRFHGLTGIVLGKQGKKGVLVSVFQGHALKTMIVHASHLKPVGEKGVQG